MESAPSPSGSSCPSTASASKSCSSASTQASTLFDTQPITSPETRLYLAIDCGGTKAAAVISDHDGRVVGRGFGGPANFTDVGLDNFLVSVQEAIRQALSHCTPVRTSTASLPPGVAGRTEPLFEAAWLGIAGVDSDGDVQQLTPYLASLLSLPYPSNRLMVANDTSLLAAPVRDPANPQTRSGVVVIAGTGSIVMSFKEDEGGMLQTLGRVGGFGWLLGDEGSGYWVGRDALRFVLDQADRDRFGGSCMFGDEVLCANAVGGRPDAIKEQSHLLRDRILDLWGLRSTDELLNAIYANRPPGQPRPPMLRSGQASPPDEEPESRSNDDGVASFNSSHGEGDASARAEGGVAHLMPPLPPAVPAPQPGSISPIPSMSPYGSIASLAPSSSDTIDESVTDLMASSTPSLGRGRFAQDDEMPMYNEPGHERAESVASARSVAVDLARSASADPAMASGQMLQERKHRLASLAPLVFHLALHHRDANSLGILRGQARRLAMQIAAVFPRDATSSAYIEPPTSVLCMGGSLLGVESYQKMVEEELATMGLVFARSVFVNDPARSGAVALANMWEAKMKPVLPSSTAEAACD